MLERLLFSLAYYKKGLVSVKKIQKFKYNEETYVKMCKRYLECFGNKKLMNQFREEHPRYYQEVKRFWHDKKRIKVLLTEGNRKYTERGREQVREFRRLHRLHSTGGKTVSGLNKRTYPSYCEICGRLKPMKLQYHHWNKNSPSMGIWVCYHCHLFVEGCDKGYIETYQRRKQQIESNHLEKANQKQKR